MSFLPAFRGTRTQKKHHQPQPSITTRAAAAVVAVFVRDDSVALGRRCEAAPLTAAAAGSERPAGPTVGTLPKQMDSAGFHLKGFYLVFSCEDGPAAVVLPEGGGRRCECVTAPECDTPGVVGPPVFVLRRSLAVGSDGCVACFFVLFFP